MSKKMTPCEKLGYKVGDRFKASKSGAWFSVEEEVELGRDDGSHYPYFFNERMPKDGYGGWPRHVDSVEKISNAKLKPAKQALADAIHQNGGWPNHGDCNFATSNDRRLACFFTERPIKGRLAEWSGWVRVAVLSGTARLLPNRHQTILSRDEYFTAYPEQVKVEVKNETKHKVEVEMKSESEATINASDWHKNGELPPVGEICEIHHSCWNESKFEKVKIAAITKDYLIVEYATFEQHYLRKDMSFRSLRTERDKAIDEMMLECQYAGDSVDKCKKFAIALYDAGYRKEVE